MILRKTALKQLKFLEKKSNHMQLAAENWENDWQRIVAIMLSARTRDETTIKVCKKIFERYKNFGDFEKIRLNEIKKLINSVNFPNNKSKNLFLMNKILLRDFDGKIPNEFEKLVVLPGVGRKTANVFLAEKGKDNLGVDTHVSYISQYMGWANSKKPEIIEKELKQLFPKSKWGQVNRTLVRFGKTYISKKKKNEILDYAKKGIK